jgi:diaminopimelate epimerase
VDAVRAHLVFRKVEGLGNDFLVVEAGEDGVARWSDGEALTVDDVRALCDRRRGVGGDGVLVVARPAGDAARTGAVASMRVRNADGTEPEMCGNGLRCVALHLALTDATKRSGASAEPLLPDMATHDAASGASAHAAPTEFAPFVVDTAAGPHAVRLRDLGDDAAVVEIDMRVPSLRPADVPVLLPGGDPDTPLRDVPFDLTQPGAPTRTLRLTAVSMGNPHAVTFDVCDPAEMAVLGPRLEADPRFPARVNVGFARLREDGALDVDVYERGVGWTDACGTGACAAVVAAVETGRVARGAEVAVHLPGGVLRVRVGAPDERVRMTGPARETFRGVVTRAAVRGQRTEPRRPRIGAGR